MKSIFKDEIFSSSNRPHHLNNDQEKKEVKYDINKQRAFLNNQAPGLKPHYQIGKMGSMSQIKTSIAPALDARRRSRWLFFKIRMRGIHEVAEKSWKKKSGKTVKRLKFSSILFKRSSKKENRKISSE